MVVVRTVLAVSMRATFCWLKFITLISILIVLSGCEMEDAEPEVAAEPDPVESFVQEHMRPGSAAFFVPSPVLRDEPVEAVLEVSPPTVGPEDLQEQLEELAGRVGEGISDSVRIASRMRADLVADRDWTIVPKDPLDQAVPVESGATWRWVVTPRVRGATRLTVTLSAPVLIDGRETSYRVTSFEKTVTVTTTRRDLASDMLTWMADHWVILAAVGTAVGGLFTWWKKRRQHGGAA